MAERFGAWKERKDEERKKNAFDMGGGHSGRHGGDHRSFSDKFGGRGGRRGGFGSDF